jgi:hypothetical protein
VHRPDHSWPHPAIPIGLIRDITYRVVLLSPPNRTLPAPLYLHRVGPSSPRLYENYQSQMSMSEPLLPLTPLQDRNDATAGQSSVPTSKLATFNTPTEYQSGFETSRSDWTSFWLIAVRRILSRCGFSTLQTATKLTQVPYHTTPGRTLPQARAFRFCFLLLATPLALLTCSFIWRSGIPNSFVDISRFERELPQHRWEVHVDPNTGELVENGCHGKRVKWEEQAGEGYLRLPSQLWRHGFGNGMEEVWVVSLSAHIIQILTFRQTARSAFGAPFEQVVRFRGLFQVSFPFPLYPGWLCPPPKSNST